MRGLGAGAYVPKPSGAEEGVVGFRSARIVEMRNELIAALAERQRIEAFAIAPNLPTCPANASAGQTYCYDGQADPSLPPGTFYAIGLVPFNVSEFKAGTRFSFQKTFSPDATQRGLLEFFVIERSAKVVHQRLASAIFNSGNNPALTDPSVNQVKAMVPGFVTTLPNFKWFPIQPSADELTNRGGFQKWISRGGYPLFQDLVNGKMTLRDEPFTPSFCVSILCRCDADVRPNAGAKVSCVKARITKTGQISQHPGNDGAFFWPFVRWEPSGQITMLLDYDDPSTLEKIGAAFAKAFDFVANTLCQSAPLAKDQFAKIAAVKCANTKTNKPCKQGEKDCKCVQPSNGSVAAVGASNLLMTGWCAGWASQQQVPTDYPIDNIMPPVEPKPIPWGWIIGGAAVVGGLLYAKNSRR